MYGEGKTRGKCSELAFPSTTNQACAAIVLNEEFEHIRPFLKLFLSARYEQTRRLASGGVQPNLSLGLIKSIEVPIPPAAEQVRIVLEAERLLSFVESLHEVLELALRRSEPLRRTILSEALGGRLASRNLAVA
jgi:type I restriction enzyme S subunit